MTKAEKADKINKIAFDICKSESGSRDDLITLVTEYYIKDVFEIEPSDERSSVNENNRRNCNSVKLMEAIFYAVKKYNPVEYPGIPLINFMGDTINSRRREIFPFDLGDKKPTENIRKYWRLMKAMQELNIDVNKITTEQISKICKKAGISEEKFNSIMKTVDIKNVVSLEFITDDGETLEKPIAVGFDEFNILELKISLMSWFVWLAQNGKQEKQNIYRMINTNGVMALDSSPLEFPDHTDTHYYEYAVMCEYIDTTITKFLNANNITMSKQNFRSTYRMPYNNHYMQYINEE